MKKKTKDLLIVTLFALMFSIASCVNKFEILNFVVYFLISEFIFYLLYQILPDTLNSKNTTNKLSKKEIIIYLILIIIPIIVAIMAYYPASVSSDSLDQWRQVQMDEYNNWHPIFHTLMFLKLPSLIYNNMLSCTIFQSIFTVLILLYFCYFLRKNYLSFKQTLFVIFIIVFNPIFLHYNVTIWKDIPYSWAMFLATLFLIDITKTNGKWLEGTTNKILFLITSLLIFLTRHNGVVPLFFMFVGLMIFYPKSRKFLGISLVSILVLYYGVLGSLINLKNGGKAEMIGIVCGQISYYYNNGVEFSEDELELMNKLAPLETWKKYYNPGNFNLVKWNSDTYTIEASKPENFKKILTMWLSKSIKNPIKCIKSYSYITSAIWGIKHDLSGVDYKNYQPETEATKKGAFKDISYSVYNRLIIYNNNITDSPFRLLFLDFGDSFFLIIVGLYLIIKKSKSNIRRWLPFVPVVLNTMVIMVLMTGEEYRFVYSQILCCYPLLIYGLFEKKESNFKSKLVKFFKDLFVNKTDNSLIQFVRYFFVGGVAAVVNIGMLYVFTDLFHVYYLVSNVFSFTLGLIVNYLLSKKLVFQDEKQINKSKEFLIYAIIGVLGLGFDTLLMGLFTGVMKIYYMLSKIISTMLVFIWNFVARKVFYKIIK